MAQNSDTRAKAYFIVRNTTEEWIPAGALMRTTGIDPDTGDTLVAKPDEDSKLGLIVNGFSAIGPASLTDENRGQATSEARCAILCASPAAGDPQGKSVTWGSKAGEWEAFPNRGGFRLLESPGDASVDRLVNAVRSSEIVFYAKITSATPASSGTTTTSTTTTPAPPTTTSTCAPTTTTTPGPTTTTTTPSPTTTTTTPDLSYATGANYYPAILVYFLASADVWIETSIVIWFRDVYGRRPGVGDLVRVDQYGEYGSLPLYVGYDVPYVAPGTTSTTTTPQPCGGLSKWIFDFTAGVWKLSEICCSPGCVPEPPDFCPAADEGCATTQTYCVRPGGNATTTTPCPAYTTTTTPGPTTTTTPGPTTTSTPCPTTTPAPDCSGCVYTWIPGWGWSIKTNNCANGVGSDSCQCPAPPGGAGSVCYDVSLPCVTTTTTPAPAEFCLGSCRWVWVDEDIGWLYLSGGCASNFPACKSCGPCVAPTVPPKNPVCGTMAVTGCRIVDSCPTTTTTTPGPCDPPPPEPTTTTTPRCNGKCKWRWSAFSEEWIFQGSTDCSDGCDCFEPIYEGIDDCSVEENRCTEQTTTTTPPPTTTTTTTTTPPPTTTTTTTTPPPTTTTTTEGPKYYCVEITTTYGMGTCFTGAVVGTKYCIDRFPGDTVIGNTYNRICGGGTGHYYVVLSGPYANPTACEAAPCGTTTTTTPPPTTTTTTTTPTTTTTTTPAPTTTTTTPAPSNPWWCCGIGTDCIQSATKPNPLCNDTSYPTFAECQAATICGDPEV